MKTTLTYSEWVTLFDSIKNRIDDTDNLQKIQNSTFAGTGVALQRLLTRLSRLIETRLNQAKERFDKIGSQPSVSEATIIQGLLALRREYVYAYELVSAMDIPEEYKTQIQHNLVNIANEMQLSLESSANNSDVFGRFSALIRNHKVNTIGENHHE